MHEFGSKPLWRNFVFLGLDQILVLEDMQIFFGSIFDQSNLLSKYMNPVEAGQIGMLLYLMEILIRRIRLAIQPGYHAHL